MTGTKCRLYSAVISRNWDPKVSPNYTSELTSLNCFSSWHRRNDIIGTADLTAKASVVLSPPENAKDGFYCPKARGFIFHSRRLDERVWFQADLKSYYTLRFVRVSIRETRWLSESRFKDVEFRFGNETIEGDISLNHVIGFAAGHQDAFEGVVVEYCMEYHLVGRYLSLQEKGSFEYLVFGEIQVTVS